jgi:hypothetical protein
LEVYFVSVNQSENMWEIRSDISQKNIIVCIFPFGR